MEQIKFRYVFRKPNGHIIKYFTDIQHLEYGDIALFLQHNFLAFERDLISRDLFTGKQDQNGREVYARDIIECKVIRDDNIDYWINIPPRYFVDWVASGRWGLKPRKDSAFWTMPAFLSLHWEIIGNMHENLGLLGVGLIDEFVCQVLKEKNT